MFKNSDIDSLIWFAPYKACHINKKGKTKYIQVTRIVIYDVKNFMKNKMIKRNIYDYDKTKMMTTEK